MINNQAYLFLIFTLDGIIIGLLFDFFRILRKIVKTNNLFTYLEDVIFWILTGILILYSIYFFNNGEIRLYMFLGIFLGVLGYVLTISKYIISFFVYISTFIKMVLISIIKYLFAPIKFLFKLINKLLFKQINFFIINVKKINHKVLQNNIIIKNMSIFFKNKFKKIFFLKNKIKIQKKRGIL